jgi:diguanylate cyclase (GGDEF)-like protein
LLGGIALTVLSTGTMLEDFDRLRNAGADHGVVDSMARTAVLRSSITVALLGLLWRFVLRPMANNLATERAMLRDAEEAQTAILARQELTAQVHEALDMADDEATVHRVVSRTMARIAPALPAELLLADSSRAHLQSVASNPEAGAPGCDVSSPWSCPAVRHGRTTVFRSSGDIHACPHLAARERGRCWAVCVPVTFMGRNLGGLHVAGADGEPPASETVDALSVVAGQAGVRIGLVRAFVKAQLQAATDGLTGLSNRRATGELVGRLLRQERVVSVAMIDLDHFKTVNDAYGHEAGDRALRAFAETARRTLREEDVIGRWGGEEFVVALPGLDRSQAVVVLDRLRAALADAAAKADTPAVTASMGVVDSTISAQLDEAVRLADEALLAAKAQGRNRVVVGPVVLDPSALAMTGRQAAVERAR